MGIENRNSKKFQKTGSSNPSGTRKNIANNRGGDSSPRNSNFKVRDNSRSRAKGVKVAVNKGNNKQSKSGTQKRNNRFNNDNITYNNNNTNNNGKRVNNNQNKKLGNGSKNTPSNNISVNNQKNNQRKRPKAPIETMRVMPLGGLKEIGKNITLVEYKNDILIIDCGFSFPEDEMFGIDVVIPDFTYLKENMERIKGLIITHGHEDHIGSIPYLLKKVNVPIYSTAFTIGLINSKLKEHNLDAKAELNVVEFGDIIKLGKFSVEFIASAHSIPDSAMLAIKTDAGTIIHSGDFKIEYTPVDGKHMNLSRLGELGREGVLALLSDSTNAERKGFTMSEASVGKVFDKMFENCKKRIIVATFASNVNRVQGLVNLARKYGRKVAVSGRSMEKMLEIARELDYIDAPDEMFVDLDLINTIEDNRLLILTTGSQGEPMSALTRIAVGQHKKIKLQQNDLVVISATPIPGNEPSVSKVINSIMKRGVEVVYSSLEHIHVSGHACQEEQKLLLELVKPKYFLPVHGEIRQLYAHRATAVEMGIDKKNIMIMENR